MAITQPALDLRQMREVNEAPPRPTLAAKEVERPRPEVATEEGYYGLPMLKRPTWGWQIAWYFFLEGVSSGAFLTASLAELFGGERMKPAVRAARRVAFLSFLPCPSLLIDDLGDPARFHNMLRVFKQSSPMNLGAWAL